MMAGATAATPPGDGLDTLIGSHSLAGKRALVTGACSPLYMVATIQTR
jgi:hypothetical protein